jgi:hypothetical protein
MLGRVGKENGEKISFAECILYMCMEMMYWPPFNMYNISMLKIQVTSNAAKK